MPSMTPLSRARPDTQLPISALVLPASPVSGLTPCPDVDRVFASRADLHSLVVHCTDGSYALLDRIEFEYEMNAGYGYGRMLYQRAPIEQLIDPARTLTLPGHTPIHDAYDAVMQREARTRFRDVIVLDDRGGVGTVRVAELLDEIARLNASDALHDHLTGLANRALMTEWLDHALLHIDPPGRNIALLFLDIDRFKVVNDSIGHDAGDDLLCQFSERLQGCLRPTDAAARLGGDEFAILLDQIGEGSQAAIVARRIQDALRLPIRVGGRELVISSSIGIALAQRGDDSMNLLRKADIAMYQAKRAGGGRFQFFHGDQGNAAQARLDLEVWLRGAVAEQQLQLRYQPIVSLDTGLMIGVEALVRGLHPQRGLLGPSEFLPIAEETGLIRQLDRAVFLQACRTLQRWAEAVPGGPALAMSVNVSAERLEDRGLPAEIAGTIEETGLDPRLIQIEITESSMVRHLGHAVRTLETIRRMGVRVAMDDFGTGYASLSHLSKLPLDTLKIDASFVAGIDGPQDQAIVRLLIALAGAMQVAAVAEGVETARQAALLRELGCHFGQGFLFARPLTETDIIKLLRDGGRIIPAPAQAGPRPAEDAA